MKKVKNFRIVFSVVSLVVLIVFALAIFVKSGSQNSKLNLNLNNNPYSSDPYEYNELANRPVSGSVHIGLFTSYKDGKISPLLAKDWKSSDSDRVWTFRIRKDVTFTDGVTITPLHVKNSLKRIFYLANRNNSKQPLLENIIGAKSIKKISEEVEGISADQDSITIKLKESDPLLLEKLSFGFYAAVSPKNYNELDGKWNPVAAVFSGPYELVETNKESYKLKLRLNYPTDLYVANAFKEIVMTWDKKKRDASDLFEAYETEEISKNNFKFYGNTNSFVIYFRVYNWNNLKSVFSSLENRLCIRELFYQNLKGSPVKVVRSLFPLILPGVEEVPEIAQLNNCSIPGAKKTTVRLIKNTQVKKFAATNDALVSALKILGFEVNATEFKDDKESQVLAGARGNLKNARIDIAALATDIGNEDPRYTTKFMLSKDGIFLPDPNKRMEKIVKNPSFSLNQINEELFNDGIIWPVFHYSFGFYINENKIDLSRFNHQWPLAELQWIGAK